MIGLNLVLCDIPVYAPMHSIISAFCKWIKIETGKNEAVENIQFMSVYHNVLQNLDKTRLILFS